MGKISDVGSRSVGAAVALLGGSLLLSACGSPVAPTTPGAEEVAAAANEAGRVSKAAFGQPNYLWCRDCPSAIDPVRVPPNKPVAFQAYLANTGDGSAATVRVSLFLVTTEGRMTLVAESDHDSPRPGTRAALDLTFVVPARMPAGRYAIALVADPANRIAESDESDNTAAFVGALEVTAS
jgi:hypothetical protein